MLSYVSAFRFETVPRLTSHDAAASLLRARGAWVSRVVRIDTEHYPASVLYLGAAERPMTAWLWPCGGETVVCWEPGFAATPRELPPLRLADGHRG